MLTPEDITSRSFLVSLRGYDRDEVHAFLAQVADEVRDLLERVDELEEAATAPAGAPGASEAEPAPAPEAAATPPTPSDLFAEIGKETQRILEAAQHAGEDLRKSAKEDADRELKTARAEATRIIAEGERRREAIEESVAQLTAARGALAGELREVGRSVERALRDLMADDETTGTMREAVAASVREDARAEDVGDAPGGADGDDDVPAPVVEGAETADATEPLSETDIADAADIAIDALAPDGPPKGEPETAGEPGAAGEDLPASDELDPGLIEEAQALRAQALAPLHPKLVRKLKRGLQDLQNGMLDRLRRADAKGEADRFLPDYSAVSTLSALAEEFLTTAWWAGTASGELLAGEEVEAPEPDGPLAEELTSSLADQLLASLAEGLEAGLSAGEDIVGLGERIGVIFGEVKEAPVEELAALALLRTYEEGMRATWQVGSATHRHWALASEPPCTDPRCAENHREGPAPLGSPFASGHEIPPVRVGCNCTTIPVSNNNNTPRSESAS